MSGKQERSVSTVTLSGTLQDVIVRRTKAGDTVSNGTLILVDSIKDGRERRQFHRVVFWKGLGTRAAELPKGAKVRIGGRLETAAWEDAHSGQKKTRVQIVANSLEAIEHLQEIPAGPVKITAEQIAGAITPSYTSEPESRKLTGKQIATAVLRPVTAADPITNEDVPF
jgi:single-strand DNA-binding protein